MGPRAGVLGTEPRGVFGWQGGRRAPHKRRRPRRKGLRERPRHPGTQEPCCGGWTQGPSPPFPEPVWVGGAFVSSVSLLPPVASSVLPAQPGAVTQPDMSQRPTGATEQGERSPLPEPESPLCHLPRCFGLCLLEPLPQARPWAPWVPDAWLLCHSAGGQAHLPGEPLSGPCCPNGGWQAGFCHPPLSICCASGGPGEPALRGFLSKCASLLPSWLRRLLLPGTLSQPPLLHWPPPPQARHFPWMCCAHNQ